MIEYIETSLAAQAGRSVKVIEGTTELNAKRPPRRASCLSAILILRSSRRVSMHPL
jgi:hypothetical protein